MSSYLVHALVQLGDTPRARKIAEVGIDFLNRQRRMQGGVHVIGTEDAGYYASSGERELMLERLDEAIEGGWVRFAMETLDRPMQAPYRDDDAFQALLEKLRSRVAVEREKYLESL